jgi:hypothetical protein
MPAASALQLLTETRFLPTMSRHLHPLMVDASDKPAVGVAGGLYRAGSPAISSAEKMSIAVTKRFWDLILADPIPPDRSGGYR